MTREQASSRRSRAVSMPQCIVLAAFAILGEATALQQTFVAPSGVRLKMLLDADRTGAAEIEVGEITFPAGADSGDHQHGSTEIFYVLSGELEHIVNGERIVLTPGTLGFVRPPDRVRHRVGPAGPAKALVIWVPAGEAGRITSRWRREP